MRHLALTVSLALTITALGVGTALGAGGGSPAPQALVYWCPSRGRCTLAVYMYRAPPGTPPATWGDLLCGTGTG